MKKILCIDDDPVTIMFCTGIIKRNSFAAEVVSALGGQQAIDLIWGFGTLHCLSQQIPE